MIIRIKTFFMYFKTFQLISAYLKLEMFGEPLEIPFLRKIIFLYIC
jgi:hypothetical protein